MLLVVSILLTICAYLLFFVYDWFNVRYSQSTHASLIFLLGIFFVVASTSILLWNSLSLFAPTAHFVFGVVLAAFSFAGILWALVFSLPKGTYEQPGERRLVYEGGAYALCRHPGVFFYCCFYLGLLIALPSFENLLGFLVLCLGNVAYMFFQDRWSFPLLLEGYEDYKRRSNLFVPRFCKRM